MGGDLVPRSCLGEGDLLLLQALLRRVDGRWRGGELRFGARQVHRLGAALELVDAILCGSDPRMIAFAMVANLCPEARPRRVPGSLVSREPS